MVQLLRLIKSTKRNQIVYLMQFTATSSLPSARRKDLGLQHLSSSVLHTIKHYQSYTELSLPQIVSARDANLSVEISDGRNLQYFLFTSTT